MSDTDREIELRLGNQRARIGEFGASLRGYWVGDREIVWSYSGLKNKLAGQGDVLMPFPSRIKGGRYTFDGKAYQLPLNDKEGAAAIHGFLREVKWRVVKSSDHRVGLQYSIRGEGYASRGYPFTLDCSVSYELGENGLSCGFEIANLGKSSAPFGVGFHPYFMVSDLANAEVLIPAEQVLEFGPGFIPTGQLLPVAQTEVDFRKSRRVGAVQINHCFTRLARDGDGMARAKIHDPKVGKGVTVWMDSSFNYIVAYTGDAIQEPFRRKSFAIEPLTCATDAFNHPEWGLKVLKPGEIFRGAYGVTAQ